MFRKNCQFLIFKQGNKFLELASFSFIGNTCIKLLIQYAINVMFYSLLEPSDM